MRYQQLFTLASLNILILYAQTTRSKIAVPSKIRRPLIINKKGFSRTPAEYYFKIAVSGDNARTVYAEIVVDWPVNLGNLTTDSV